MTHERPSFLVMGLRRSGLHLLSEWLLSSTGGTVFEYEYTGAIVHAQTRQSTTGKGDGKVMIVEDMPPEYLTWCIDHFQRLYGSDVRPIVALRSLENFAASRIRILRTKPTSNKVWHGNILDWWKGYAKTGQAEKWLYDQFISDPEYRRQWAETRGIEVDESVLDHYASRDSFTMVGRGKPHADREIHLTRYESMIDDELFQQVMSDTEAVGFNTMLFGKTEKATA